MTRELTRVEGLFAGMSSGAVMQVALRVAERIDKGNVVALLADGGWKYLSSGLWTEPFEKAAAEIQTKVWW
ncbi:MAG: hypothetical protein IT307_16360 [Chloroflexi bacterium]|nr:hypothetical protein [Chloroflexota bacterium]